MSIFRIGSFEIALILATVLSIATWSTAGHAYTPEQQQACTNDAFRLCGPDIPDVDRVTACMIRNKSQLSPECRASTQMRRPTSGLWRASRRPGSLRTRSLRKSLRRPDGFAPFQAPLARQTDALRRCDR
jgi:hypothetical protein